MSADADERPIINFEGKLVSLGPMRREYIPLYLRWINDFGTSSNLAIQPSPMTLEEEQAWYDSVASGSDGASFTIFERSTGRPIGNCGLHKVNFMHRRTDVGIMIGEPSARGKGYGTEAMHLLVDYAISVLGMHNVLLSVYEYNHPARRCYQKVGFREIGRRREARWHNGRFWDEIMMDILASEFASPVLKKLLEPEPPR